VFGKEWLVAAFWCLGLLGLAAWFRSVRGRGRKARVTGVAALIVGLAVCAVGVWMTADVLAGNPIVYDNPRLELELRLSLILIALVTTGAGGWSLHSAWRLLKASFGSPSS